MFEGRVDLRKPASLSVLRPDPGGSLVGSDVLAGYLAVRAKELVAELWELEDAMRARETGHVVATSGLFLPPTLRP